MLYVDRVAKVLCNRDTGLCRRCPLRVAQTLISGQGANAYGEGGIPITGGGAKRNAAGWA